MAPSIGKEMNYMMKPESALPARREGGAGEGKLGWETGRSAVARETIIVLTGSGQVAA